MHTPTRPQDDALNHTNSDSRDPIMTPNTPKAKPPQPAPTGSPTQSPLDSCQIKPTYNPTTGHTSAYTLAPTATQTENTSLKRTTTRTQRALWATLWLMAAATGCGDDTNNTGSGDDANNGFVSANNDTSNNDAPNNDNNDVDNNAPNNDAPNNDQNNDAPNNDGNDDPCALDLYERLDGVYAGTLTTITSGAGLTEQISTTDISIDFDLESSNDNTTTPGCTLTQDFDQCFFETGTVTTLVCNTNGLLTNSETTYQDITNTDTAFGYTSETEQSTRQDGELLSESQTNQVFLMELVNNNEDAISYTFTTITTTINGPVTSQGEATLTRQ